MRVKISEDFRTSYKQLKKRHRSLDDDFERLLNSLMQNPMQGVELFGGARKIRLAITSKGRGKSGGARVIIRVRIVQDDHPSRARKYKGMCQNRHIPLLKLNY